MRWYINRTGAAEGPYDEPTILGMISRGEVQPNHQICVEGQQAWQPLTSHPPFAGGASQPAAQVGAAAHQVAGGVEQAANQVANDFGGAANQAANQLGGAANALAAGQAPAFTQSAAPGEGFFESAMNQAPSEEAKKAAGMAHLLAAGGMFLGCWACGLGGVVGAFVGSILYKETPKHPFALFHINQALAMQAVLWAVALVITIISRVGAIAGAHVHELLGMACGFVGLLNLPIFLAAIILPVLQYMKASKGEWSKYPFVGGRVMKLKSPMLK